MPTKNKLNIKIGGKTRTARLGLGFIETAVKAENPKDNDITQISTPRLLYYSLKYGTEREKKEVNFDLYDVFDWIDEIGVNDPVIKKFQIAFFESLKVHLNDKDAEKAIDEVKDALSEKKTKKKAKKNG